MEHRLSTRGKLSTRGNMGLDVLLYENGIPSGVGLGRDISLLGMYIETPSAQSVRRHQILEIEFVGKDSGQGHRRFRVPAMVVRQEGRGVGVIFETSDRITRDAVRALLAEQRDSAGNRHPAGVPTLA
jgi:hypothetical protein